MRRFISRQWAGLPVTTAIFVLSVTAVALGPFDGHTGTLGTWGSWASLVALAASAVGLLKRVLIPRDTPASPPDLATRTRLLRATDEIWVNGRLRGRLAVDHAMRARLADVETLHDRRLHPRPLPDDATVESAFDLRREQILILGEAGVGKSTQALLLVAALLREARNVPALPIPVVLPLATWGRHPDLLDWMAGQLGPYQVSAQRGRSWLAQGVLLPVLDGLDEISDPTQRARCVDAINSFLAAHEGRPLIVCSRRTAYEELPIRFSGSLCPVLVRRPTPADRDDFLDALGDRGERIRAALVSQPRLDDVLDTPLALTIAAKAFQDLDVDELRTADVGLGKLWDTYLDATFVHPLGLPQPYPEEAARRWLDWVAWRSVISGTSRVDLNELQGGEIGRYMVTVLAALSIVSGAAYALGWLSGWVAVLFAGVLTITYLPKNDGPPGRAQRWMLRSVQVLQSLVTFVAMFEAVPAILHRQLLGVGVGIGCVVVHPFLVRLGRRRDRDTTFRWFTLGGLTLFIPTVLAWTVFGEPTGADFVLGYALMNAGYVGWDFVAVRVWSAVRRARAGNGPWRYRRFLRWATEQLWLVRVGDQFELVHPTLLEHLAVNLDVERFRPTSTELGRLGAFLANVKRTASAGAVYKRALATAPRDPEILGGYALYLEQVESDADRVREAYERALAVDGTNPSNVVRYAEFLLRVEADFEGAQRLYALAVGARPKDQQLLRRYIGFLIKTGEDDKAMPFYEQVVALAPNEAELLLRFANFLRTARPSGAGQAFERALAADPEHPVILTGYGAYLRDIGEVDRAQEMYERAAAIRPVDRSRVERLTSFLHDIGHDDDARNVYTSLIEAAPADTSLLLGFARFLASIDDRAGAAHWYGKAMTTAPADPVVLGSRASFLHKTGDPSTGEAYEDAVAADPDYATTLGNYGIFLHHVVGDLARAREFYERAAAAAPHDVGWLDRLVRYLQGEIGDSEATQKAYEDAVARAPHDATIVGRLATYLAGVDDPDAALVYRRALDLDQNHAENLYNFARFTQMSGDHEEAIRLYRRAVGAAPRSVKALRGYAGLLEATGAPGLARPMYERALAVAPTDDATVHAVALHLQDNGDRDRARKVYEQAIEDGGASHGICNGLGTLLWNDCDLSGAEELYRRALTIAPDSVATINLIELLFVTGRREEAAGQWVRLVTREPSSANALDLWLLAVAHLPERHDEALRQLAELLGAGVRSPRWDFSVTIRLLREAGAPAVDFLEALGEVVSGRRGLSALDAFPIWRATTAGSCPPDST